MIYRETHWLYKRVFEFHEDHVIAHGIGLFGPKFREQVKYNEMVDSEKILYISDRFRLVQAIVPVVVGLILIFSLIQFSDNKYISDILTIILVIVLAFLILSLLIVFNKVEARYFKNESGRDVLSIWKCGSDRNSFDETVEFIIKKFNKKL